MKIFVTNLKLLYQKRGMWGWYLIVGFGIWTYFSRSVREASPENQFYTGFASPLWVLIASGAGLGRLFTDTWKQPSFFCLPGRIETSKKMLLFFGLLAAILISLSVEYFFPWMTSGVQGTFILLTGYYLMFYWISVTIAYHFYRAAIVVVSISYFCFPVIARIGLWYIVNNFLLDHVWLSAAAFFVISFLLYRFLGKRLFVKHAGDPLSFKRIFQSAGTEPDRSASGFFRVHHFKNRYAKALDSFFYNRIRRNNRSSILPHLSGRNYVIIKSMLFNWKLILFLNIFFFLISCIFVNRYNTLNLLPFFFSLFGVLVGYMCMVPKSDILFPISRKGRFFVETTTVVTAIVIAFVFGFILVLLSKLIPENIILLMFGPDPTAFISFNAKYIVFTVLFLPATSAFIKIFRNKIILSAIGMTATAVGLSSVYFFINSHWINLSGRSHPFTLPVAMVISFGFYLATIYYDSFKRSFY